MRRESARHESGLAARSAGVQSGTYWEHQPGARVMTSDGFPGRVTAVLDGPYPGYEEYTVELDGGLGGGAYVAGQLRPLASAPATAAIDREASEYHLASDDYEELGTLLHDRPDPAHHVASLSKTASGFVPYYHGTNEEFERGALIEPGHPPVWESSSPEHVHFTDDPDAADSFAQTAVDFKEKGSPRTYQVEPTGPHEDDPELAHDDTGFSSYRSEHPLRVIRQIGIRAHASLGRTAHYKRDDPYAWTHHEFGGEGIRAHASAGERQATTINGEQIDHHGDAPDEVRARNPESYDDRSTEGGGDEVFNSPLKKEDQAKYDNATSMSFPPGGPAAPPVTAAAHVPWTPEQRRQMEELGTFIPEDELTKQAAGTPFYPEQSAETVRAHMQKHHGPADPSIPDDELAYVHMDAHDPASGGYDHPSHTHHAEAEASAMAPSLSPAAGGIHWDRYNAVPEHEHGPSPLRSSEFRPVQDYVHLSSLGRMDERMAERHLLQQHGWTPANIRNQEEIGNLLSDTHAGLHDAGLASHSHDGGYDEDTERGLCAYQHDGPCDHPGDGLHEAGSLRHPRPENFHSGISVNKEPAPRDPETHHLHGYLDGKPVGQIAFDQSDDGRAVHVGMLHTSGTKGRGIASAMMDDLYHHVKSNNGYIDHGWRTGAGLNWWNSYREPHPELSTHNTQPSNDPGSWADYFNPHDVARDMEKNHYRDPDQKHQGAHFNPREFHDYTPYEQWKHADDNVSGINTPEDKDDDDSSWAQRSAALIVEAATDHEARFEVTATWQDVLAKAARIRREGHVRITFSSRNMVIGEVKGDHHVYETGIQRMPGGPASIGHWNCGCKWASHHQAVAERSAMSFQPLRAHTQKLVSPSTRVAARRARSYSGRPCSHVMALQLEAQSQGIGTAVSPDRPAPARKPRWVPSRVVVKYDIDEGRNEFAKSSSHDSASLPYMSSPDDEQLGEHLHKRHGMDPENFRHGDDAHWQRWHDAEHHYITRNDHQHAIPSGHPMEEEYPAAHVVPDDASDVMGISGGHSTRPWQDVRQTGPFIPDSPHYSRATFAAELTGTLLAAGEDPESVALMFRCAGIELSAAANDPFGGSNTMVETPGKPYGATSPPNKWESPASAGFLAQGDPENWGSIEQFPAASTGTSHSGVILQPPVQPQDGIPDEPENMSHAGPAGGASSAMAPKDPSGMSATSALRAFWAVDTGTMDDGGAGHDPVDYTNGAQLDTAVLHDHPEGALPSAEGVVAALWHVAMGPGDQGDQMDSTSATGEPVGLESSNPDIGAADPEPIAPAGNSATPLASPGMTPQTMQLPPTIAGLDDELGLMATPADEQSGFEPDDTAGQDEARPSMSVYSNASQVPQVPDGGGGYPGGDFGGPGAGDSDESLSPDDMSIQTVGLARPDLYPGARGPGRGASQGPSKSAAVQESGGNDEILDLDPSDLLGDNTDGTGQQMSLAAHGLPYRGSDTSDSDIAKAARLHLQKLGMDTFSDHEARQLISEGQGQRARNLDRLDLSGTHYLKLEAELRERGADDVEDDLMWV